MSVATGAYMHMMQCTGGVLPFEFAETETETQQLAQFLCLFGCFLEFVQVNVYSGGLFDMIIVTPTSSKSQ